MLTQTSSLDMKAPVCKPIHLRQQTSPSELFHYGNLYYQEKKYIQAIGSYRAAAEQGHAAAQFSLGRCLYYGHGLPVNCLVPDGILLSLRSWCSL